MAAKTEKITIKEREIEVEIDEWSIERFHLDLANPRYMHIKDEDRESDEKMEASIWAEDESKDLFQSIKTNRGLITPIFAKHDGTVVEGNRRVTVLRHLKRQIEDGKEDKRFARIVERVPCRIFPDDFSLEERALFLAYEHVTGKKPWPAMNEAAHIWYMNNELGYSLDQLAHFLGKSKTYIQQKIWAYQKTREYWKFNKKDKDVARFSYFEELWKNRGSLGYNEKDDPDGARELLNLVFRGIKEGLFNVDAARDMRHFGKVLQDVEAKDAFLSGTSYHGREIRGMEAGLRVLEERYPSTPAFEAIKNTLDQLNRMPHSEYAEIPGFKRKIELLYELRDRIDTTIKDLALVRPTTSEPRTVDEQEIQEDI